MSRSFSLNLIAGHAPRQAPQCVHFETSIRTCPSRDSAFASHLLTQIPHAAQSTALKTTSLSLAAFLFSSCSSRALIMTGPSPNTVMDFTSAMLPSGDVVTSPRMFNRFATLSIGGGLLKMPSMLRPSTHGLYPLVLLNSRGPASGMGTEALSISRSPGVSSSTTALGSPFQRHTAFPIL